MHTNPQPQNLTIYQRLTSDKKNDSLLRSKTFLNCFGEPAERRKILTIIRVIVDYALAYPVWITLMLVVDIIRSITGSYNFSAIILRTTSVRSIIIKDPTPIFRGLDDSSPEIATLLTHPKNRKLVQLVLAALRFPVLLWALYSGLTMTTLCSLAICSVTVLVKAYEVETEGLRAEIEKLKKEKEKILQGREEEWDVVNNGDE
jgi:hypothetical protein